MDQKRGEISFPFFALITLSQSCPEPSQQRLKVNFQFLRPEREDAHEHGIGMNRINLLLFFEEFKTDIHICQNDSIKFFVTH
jgi:hypothetical protein